MMRKHQLLLAAVALCWAVAAGAAQAAGENFYAPQQWGGEEVTDQAVDGTDFRRMVETEPGAVIVGAVAANNRERITGLEGHVGELEGRVDGHDTELRRQAQSYGPSYPPNDPAQTPGDAGSTTINNNYYAPPAPPPAAQPQPPPSGGDENDSKPAEEPEKERAPMSPWTILGIIIVGAAAVVGAIILFQYVAVALRRRRREDDIELAEQRRVLDEQLIAGQFTALDALLTPAAGWDTEEYSGVIRTSLGFFGRRKGQHGPLPVTPAPAAPAAAAAAAGP